MRKVGRNFDTFGSAGGFESLCGRFPAKGSTVIGVHPSGNSDAVCLRHSGQRTALLEPAANHTVGVFVAAALAAGERMTVVAVCAPVASWGVFQAVGVRELHAVIHGNALEDMPEVRAALKVIQHGHHGGGILTRNFEDQFHASQTLRHDNDRFANTLLFAHNAIHLPMAKGGALRDNLRTLLNTGTMSGRLFLLVLLPGMLTDAMLRQIRGACIQQATPEVAVNSILAEIAKIRGA